MSLYTHILVAVDFTEKNKLVVEKAQQLRQLTQAKLSVLHVVEPIPANSYGFIDVIDFEAQMLDRVREELNTLAKQLNLSERDCHLEMGPAKSQILNTAKNIQADVIIIGSHGRHGFSALLGSTANSVAHHAKCDVIMVRIED
ncbi:MAG: universal stress protein [Legionellales bacterium]|nr:universal stress protein [Legionellales bacterium]